MKRNQETAAEREGEKVLNFPFVLLQTPDEEDN